MEAGLNCLMNGAKPDSHTIKMMLKILGNQSKQSNIKQQYLRHIAINRLFLRFAQNSYAKPSMGTPPPNFIFSMKHAVRFNRICLTF